MYKRQEVFSALFRGGAGAGAPWLPLLVAVGLALSFVPGDALRGLRLRFARLPLAAQGAFFALLLVAFDVLGPRGVAPFIYFQF